MAKRLRAKVGMNYPPDKDHQRILRDAGGRSKLTDEQRAVIVYKEVAAGDWVDDLPEDIVEHYLANGRVEEVDADAVVVIEPAPDPPQPAQPEVT